VALYLLFSILMGSRVGGVLFLGLGLAFPGRKKKKEITSCYMYKLTAWITQFLAKL